MENKIQAITITTDDAGRLRKRITLTAMIAVVMGVLYATMGSNVLVNSGAIPTCATNDPTLYPFLINSTFSLGCISLSLGRILVDILLLGYTAWFTAATIGEKGWVGLKKSILTPDSNESPILLLIGYVAFLMFTAHSVPFTTLPQFFVVLMFRLARNILTAMAFNFALLRLFGIKDLDQYLRENVSPFSNGLPLVQWLALIISMLFWRSIG